MKASKTSEIRDGKQSTHANARVKNHETPSSLACLTARLDSTQPPDELVCAL